MPRLSDEQIAQELTQLPDWEYTNNALHREFRFRTFREAMAFVNAVADLAEELRHHPDITITYNRVQLALTSHDSGGVTERDVNFVKQLEQRQLWHVRWGES